MERLQQRRRRREKDYKILIYSVRLIKLITLQPYEPGSLILLLQLPSNDPYLSRVNPTSPIRPYFLIFILIIFSHVLLGLPRCLFPTCLIKNMSVAQKSQESHAGELDSASYWQMAARRDSVISITLYHICLMLTFLFRFAISQSRSCPVVLRRLGIKVISNG